MSSAVYRRVSRVTKHKRVITGNNVRLDNELRGIKAGIHGFRSTLAREKASQEASRKASIVEASRQRRAQVRASEWVDMPMAPMDDYDMGPGDSSFDFAEEIQKQSDDDAYADRQDQYIQQRLSSVPKGKRKQYALSMIVWTNEWKDIRRDLLDVYLRYQRLEREEKDTSAAGIEHLQARCICPQTYHREVAFVEQDKHWFENVVFCGCIKDPVRLLARGFIAVSPTRPTTALSLKLVAFFQTIWQSVPISVSGFASGVWSWQAKLAGALMTWTSYKPRNGGPLLRQALYVYRDLLFQEEEFSKEVMPLSTLEQLATTCPPCFGPRVESDLLPRDSHFIGSFDGCFSQKRPSTAAKNDFAKFVPSTFLNQGILAYASQLEEGSQGRARQAAEENDAACAGHWKAKDGGVGSGAFKGLEDTGLFGFVCRHDSCVKLINLVKSGEKMMYPLAYIIWLLNIVDPTARMGLLYDIGCNFEAHLKTRGLLVDDLESFRSRLQIGVSVFHAYAHVWPCQTKYNPRMREGFGLSDGEGVERFWSFLVPLIRLNRTANSSLRLSNIHFRVQLLNERNVDEIVKWVGKKYGVVNSRLEGAVKAIADATEKGYPEEQLRLEWADQLEEMASERLERQERKAMYKKLESLVRARDLAWVNLRKYQEAMTEEQAPSVVNAALAAASHANASRTKEMNNLHKKVNAETTKRAKLKSEIVTQAASLQLNLDFDVLQHIVRIHAAHCTLRSEFLNYKMVYEPLVRTRGGRQGALGQRELQATIKKLDGGKIKAAIDRYDNAVGDYITAYPSRRPLEKAISPAALGKRPVEDPFWIDRLFDREKKNWASDRVCQEGIRALLLKDRCLEEQRRLDAEMARIFRWAHKRSSALDAALRAWEQKRKDVGCVSSPQVVDRSSHTTEDLPSSPTSFSCPWSPRSPFSSPPPPRSPINDQGPYSPADSSISSSIFPASHVEAVPHAIFVIGQLKKKHQQLERRWVVDNICGLWHAEGKARLSDSHSVSELSESLLVRFREGIESEEDDVIARLLCFSEEGKQQAEVSDVEVVEVSVQDAELEETEENADVDALDNTLS